MNLGHSAGEGRHVSRLTRDTLALILAGGQGSRLYELTRWRAKPAVYFGGKVRIIDFPLSNCINSGVRRIGVFVDEQPARIASIVREVGLDGVQLHGDEPPGDCEELRQMGVAPIYKAFRMGPGFDPGRLSDYACDGFVLDGFGGGAPGGTGKTFDWRRARELCRRHRHDQQNDDRDNRPDDFGRHVV